MSITSYAQNFEDVMLWRALGHVPTGFYIDLGAQHPVTDSVSKAFYEKGWRGIHVEATPAYAAMLRQDRPDEIVIEAAVNDVHGVIRFFEITATGISTGDLDVARSHQERGFEVHEIVVPCVTLEDIFQQVGNQDIHWLKVDVECMEAQVLRSWGQSPARPWVVVVESTVPLTQIDNYLPWEGSLLERGYTYAYFDGLNRYYLAADQQHLASAFVSGPNVFDGFTLYGGASAPFCAGINAKHIQELAALQALIKTYDQEAHRIQGELNHLQAAQQAREQERAQRERTLQETIKELEHSHAVKELNLHQLASQDIEQAQKQSLVHLQALAEREQAFAQQMLLLQEQKQALQLDAMERERELRDLQALALDAAHKSARERESAIQDAAAAELQQTTQQAQTRLEEQWQACQARERELVAQNASALQQAHSQLAQHLQARVQREQTLAQERQLSDQQQNQQQLEWTRREKDLCHQIDLLVRDAQELKETARRQVQTHEAERQRILVTHQQQLDACATAEDQLKTVLLQEQQNRAQLGQALEQLQRALAETQATWSWRVTAPLRLFARLRGRQPLSGFLLEQSNLPSRTDLPHSVPAAAAPAAAHPIQTSETVNDMPESTSVTTLSVPTRTTSVHDLFSRSGEEFIHLAYQVLLGRAPDPEGFAYYLGRLHGGYGKPQILEQISSSPEGRSQTSTLPGLRELLIDYRKSRHWFFRWFSPSTNTQRQLNRLEEIVSALHGKVHQGNQEIETRIAHMQLSLNALLAGPPPQGNTSPAFETADTVQAPHRADLSQMGLQAQRWARQLQQVQVSS